MIGVRVELLLFSKCDFNVFFSDVFRLYKSLHECSERSCTLSAKRGATTTQSFVKEVDAGAGTGPTHTPKKKH